MNLELQPEAVFNFFQEISSIPRKSGDIDKISDYLVEFAKNRNLDFIQEKCKNVIIRKKASIGYENIGTVLLQGHMDMVCEKNKNTVHDFDHDPIKLIIKDDFLYADGTTLGADDGVALAYALAILDDNTLKHPKIEALFTVDEETTMLGAEELAEQNLDAKYMINLDTDNEGELLLSSAGGATSVLKLPIEYTHISGRYVKTIIKIRNLQGGHSGAEIDKNRGNSNQIMGRLLYELNGRINFEMVSIFGGAKNNAIPRECDVIIILDEKDKKSLEDIIRKIEQEIKYELKGIDDDFKVEIEYLEEKVEKVFCSISKQKIIDALMIYSSGVMQMSQDIKGLVETSNNLGVITTDEDKKEVIFNCAIRSSIDSQVQYIAKKHESLANLLNANIIIESVYPGWKFDKKSKLSNLCVDVFEKMYSKPMKKEAVHAGLECGVIKKKMPHLDIVSFGPNIYDIHTPQEHLSISSTKRTYEYLIKVLEKMIDIEKY